MMHRLNGCPRTPGLMLHRLGIGLMMTIAVSCQVNPPISDAPPESDSVAGVESPAPTPSTSGVYRSDRFGFQFAYAADQFVAKGETDFPPDVVAVEAVQIWTIEHDREIQAGAYDGGTEYPANTSVTVQPNPDRLSAQDWIAQSNWFTDVQDLQSQTVAGQPSVSFRSSGLYEMEQVLVPTPDGSHWVLISLGQLGSGDSDALYRQAYDQAIATLTFVSP